jgi:uncharacterized protein (DUF305 family)
MKRTRLLGAATAGALFLSACSSSNDSGSDADRGVPTSRSPQGSGLMSSMPGMEAGGRGAATGTPAAGPHDTADVQFATNMIPHHAQAVYMAELAERHAATSTLKSLAGTVKAAQNPEITQMSGWLAGWSESVRSSTYAPGSMGGMSMPGMMSDRDMTMLTDAHGYGFDRTWLTMMITHHQGAIRMAKTELAEGRNPAAKQLAQAIISAQAAEIATMRKMVTSLPE